MTQCARTEALSLAYKPSLVKPPPNYRICQNTNQTCILRDDEARLSWRSQSKTLLSINVHCSVLFLCFILIYSTNYLNKLLVIFKHRNFIGTVQIKNQTSITPLRVVKNVKFNRNLVFLLEVLCWGIFYL